MGGPTSSKDIRSNNLFYQLEFWLFIIHCIKKNNLLEMIVFAVLLVIPLSVVAFTPEVKQDFKTVEALYETLFKDFTILLRNGIVDDLKKCNREIETEVTESKLKDDFVKLESAFEKLFFDFKNEMKKELENQIDMKEIKMAIEYVNQLKEEKKMRKTTSEEETTHI